MEYQTAADNLPSYHLSITKRPGNSILFPLFISSRNLT